MIQKVKVHFFQGFWRIYFIKKVNPAPLKCVPVTISSPHANFTVQNEAESVYWNIQKVKECFVSKRGYLGNLISKMCHFKFSFENLSFENIIVTTLNSGRGLNFGPTCMNFGLK